jgi:hypothetical protein
MSTVFRNLNEASTVLWSLMGAVRVSGLAESQVLVTRISHDSDLCSIASLQTKEFFGWNVIEDL